MGAHRSPKQPFSVKVTVLEVCEGVSGCFNKGHCQFLWDVEDSGHPAS